MFYPPAFSFSSGYPLGFGFLAGLRLLALRKFQSLLASRAWKSFEIQQNAVAQQKIAVEAQAGQIRLYRKVLVVCATVVVGLILFLLRHM